MSGDSLYLPIDTARPNPSAISSSGEDRTRFLGEMSSRSGQIRQRTQAAATHRRSDPPVTRQ